jgi:lipoate---protein ligase
MKVHLLRLKHTPILAQLQLEEALLRADERNWCLVNVGTPDAIVMGISGQPEQWLNLPLMERAPVPLIRRFSGGGTVFVDRHTCFVTWICQSEALQVACCPREVMRWTAKLYAPLFSPHGFRAQENDYVLGDRKFGGNAQYLRKNRWLHHSSLLWDFNPKKMDYLAIPPRMPHYRAERPHTDFLCSLKEHWPEQQQLCDAIVSLLRKQFQVEDVSLEEAQKIADRPHRKATALIKNC